MDIGLLAAVGIAAIVIVVGLIVRRLFDRRLPALPNGRRARRDLLDPDQEHVSDQSKDAMERQRAQAYDEASRIPPSLGGGFGG
jgi:hypothetical protein